MPTSYYLTATTISVGILIISVLVMSTPNYRDDYNALAITSHSTQATTTKTNISNQTNNHTIPAQYDKFGILKIYPTKTAGEEWFMNMKDPNNDTRTEPPKMNRNNNDGSWKISDSKIRYNVFTSSGYKPDKIATLDQDELAEKGYMQSPNDWKNVEMTGFVKYIDGNNNENFDWYVRGGTHHDENNGCEGTAYKGNLYYEGNTKFGKEQWHEKGYTTTDPKKEATYSLEGKWIGYKLAVYDMPLHNTINTTNYTSDNNSSDTGLPRTNTNNTAGVKLEIWINGNGDGRTWKKIDETVDRGEWGEDGDHCNGSSDEIISWGGPVATFRWDSAKEVYIKNFSVREIQPII